jgi:MFS family permease
MRDYWQFVVDNRRFVAFGFFVAFASSFGQTYFIGVFGPSLQREFELSHTEWGLVYMLGTIASAAILPWTGKLIDSVDLLSYTVAVGFALGCACLLMAIVPGAFVLVVAIFALRQTGQGLSSHISATSMARYFEAARGRAIAIAALGFALGEAMLPFVATQSIAAIGWRWTYAIAGIIHIIVLVPFLWLLLRGHAERHAATTAALPAHVVRTGWTRRQVVTDTRFYLMLPGLTAPSLVMTGMFFHHLNVADAKTWSHAWITGSYVIYAITNVLTALVAGHLVDRFSAARLVPAVLLPMTVGLGILAASASPWVAWIYLALLGISSGLTYTAITAVWAELYGTQHLGAIRALAVAIGVLSSGLGPVTMGLLMDAGIHINEVLWLAVAYSLAGAAMLRFALRR